MINLNERIIPINIGTHKQKSTYIKNSQQGSAQSFSGQNDITKKTDPNKLLLYIAGVGAIITSAAILMTKIKKGKASSGNLKKEISNSVKNIGNKSSDKVSNAADIGKDMECQSPSRPSIIAESNTSAKDSVSKKSPAVEKLETEISNVENELIASKNRENSLKQELAAVETEKTLKVKQEMNEIINSFINITKPNNETIVREAFPQLHKHSEKLSIDLKDYNNYFNQIRQENKDFAINEGIPLISENMTKIKSVLKDSENAHELLSALNEENHYYLGSLLDLSNKFKADKVKDVVSVLQKSKKNNGDIIFNVTRQPEMYKIKKITDINYYLDEIKPKNIDFAFRKTMPLITGNSDKLKIETAYTTAKILGHITPKTKDAINIVTNNAEKLKLDDLGVGEFIKAITPANIRYISIVADNAEKLNIASCLDSSDYAIALDKAKEVIITKI